MDQPVSFRFDYYLGKAAASSSDLVDVVSHIFSNSFGMRPDGRTYRLGPKKTRARLSDTDHLFIASHEADRRCGYLFGRLIAYPAGPVAWIDSLAVLPEHRRKGVGTTLVRSFITKTESCRFIACATPNPIAALVVANASKGSLYVGECDPPEEIISVINTIRPLCPDLTGAQINFKRLLVRTDFTPISSEATKEWSPPHPSEPPPWWGLLENLPNQYEALLIVDRSHGAPMSGKL